MAVACANVGLLCPDVIDNECVAVSKQFPWFAIQVRTRHEAGVASHLRGKGYSPFLPVYKCRKRWSDRIKVADAPLFPGYLFCRFNVEKRLPILTVPGVIKIVGTSFPTPVDEHEIRAIETSLHSGLPSRSWPFMQAGERVRIGFGPLRGLEGILLEARGAHRLVVSVTLLQRSVAVEIDSALVRPLYTAFIRASSTP